MTQDKKPRENMTTPKNPVCSCGHEMESHWAQSAWVKAHCNHCYFSSFRPAPDEQTKKAAIEEINTRFGRAIEKLGGEPAPEKAKEVVVKEITCCEKCHGEQINWGACKNPSCECHKQNASSPTDEALKCYEHSAQARAEGYAKGIEDSIGEVDKCQRFFFKELSDHEMIDTCEIYKKLRKLKTPKPKEE